MKFDSHFLGSLQEIRSPNLSDVVFNLTYRDFDAEMLQSLISQVSSFGYQQAQVM